MLREMPVRPGGRWDDVGVSVGDEESSLQGAGDRNRVSWESVGRGRSNVSVASGAAALALVNADAVVIPEIDTLRGGVDDTVPVLGNSRAVPGAKGLVKFVVSAWAKASTE
jgi:hypothetical protein